MKKFIAHSCWSRAFLLSAFFSAVTCSYAASPKTTTYADSEDAPVLVLQEEDESSAVSTESSDSTEADSYANKDVTSDEAYRILVSGNARHIGDGSDAADKKPRLAPDGNQYPIATFVYSSDMPEDPTVLTETSEHNVYLTTARGGAVSTDDLASIEYGLLNLQTPLLVVLGHYPSAEVASMIEQYDSLKSKAQKEVNKAIKSKAQNSSVKTSDEMKLYNLVGPAVARAKEAYPNIDGQDLANVVSEALVWQSLETILMKSTVAQDLVRSGRLLAIAAIAEDETGKIYWLGEHPLQEEFIKEAPKSVHEASKEETSTSVVSESELPEALDEVTVKKNIANSQTNVYYKNVVDEYYVEPVYYVPSWRLFYPRVWIYRPWRGVCVRPFVPWPYWSPWGYPPGRGGLHLVFGVGRISLFIGYNACWGARSPWDPHFRPVLPWWGVDFFLDCRCCRHPEYEVLFRGFRGDIVFVPHDRRPCWRPGDPFGPGGPGDPFRPRDPHDPFKPGGPFSPEGGFVGPGGVRPGYRPGDVRPGALGTPGGRPGMAPGTPGGRPGAAPGTPGGRPGAAPGFPGGRAGSIPAAPGTRLGASPGTPGIRPGMNPRSMDAHRESEASRRAGGGFGGGGGRGGRLGSNDFSAVDSRGDSDSRSALADAASVDSSVATRDGRRSERSSRNVLGSFESRGDSNSRSALASGALGDSNVATRGGFARGNDAGANSRRSFSTLRGQANDAEASDSGLGGFGIFRNSGAGNRPANSELGGGNTRTFDSSVVARTESGSFGGRSNAGIGSGFAGNSDASPSAGISGGFGGGRPSAGMPGSFGGGRPSAGMPGSFGGGRPSAGMPGGFGGGRPGAGTPGGFEGGRPGAGASGGSGGRG